MSTRALIGAMAAVGVAVGTAAGAEQSPRGPDRGSCVRCHLELGGDLAKAAEASRNDVHAQPGLGCTACHGGDSSMEDAAAAMDPAKGFRGVPERREIPQLCGTCHADAELVKQYAPNLPTDQLAQYRTSVHAMQLAKGNVRAAVCTSCHGAHGILSTRDSRSPVHPTHVVDTCATCHAAPDASGPVALYHRSVHAEVLAAGDMSAPTCPRCHGAHGATPPGVGSVANVCGQCHPQNMALYRESPHRRAFEATRLAGCEPCHGNHEIVRPSDAWVGLAAGAVCGRCHAADEAGGKTATTMRAALDDAENLLEKAGRRTEVARSRGMLMTDAQIALEEARERLVQARTLVHTADAGRVQKTTEAAATASREALEEAEKAFSEIRYRRTGLLLALALIVVAIIALVLKIRQLDAERA